MNRWEFEQKIVLKALKDPAFKKRLLEQPKETMRDLLKQAKGIDFSLLDKIDIRVVEEQQNEWVLSLPYLAANVSTLTDAEVEKVVAANGTLPGLLAYPFEELIKIFG